MRHPSLIVGIVLALLSAMPFPGSAQNRVSLNCNWQFRLVSGPRETAEMSGFQEPSYREKKFSPVPVPSNWAVLGFEEPVYRGFKDNQAAEGYYRVSFKTPEGFSDKRVLLRFGGVWSQADVWLNGRHLGTHSSGYTSFAFVVTGLLRSDGSDNLLAVKVSQTGREYKFDTFDDWTLGGIYRDVELEAMPAKRWIDSVTAVSRLDENYADADLDLKIFVSDTHKGTLPGNYPSPGEPYRLHCTLTDPDGGVAASRTLDVPAHISTGRETHLVMHLSAPRKWTAETPDLYQLRVELEEGGTVSQVWEDRIGIREISTSGGVLRINGQPVKLRGVNRHDEWPTVGRATRREHWLKDLTMMKEANINYVRCSHYAPAEGFMRMCDSLGMDLSCEVSLGGAGDAKYDPSFNGAFLVRADETVKRDINRPSVIIWSVGNEDSLSPLHFTAVKYVKALDPTRPTLIPWRHEEWLPRELDMLSIHYWKPEEYDRHAAHSDRPVVSTEYAHAYGNDGMGGLDERWQALTRHPAGAGAAIWMWADQGIYTPTVRPDTYSKVFSTDPHLRIDGAGWDGIVDSFRNPTGDYWEAKAVYAPVYTRLDAIRFTPGTAEAVIPLINAYDFTDLSQTKIVWEIFREGVRLAEGEQRLEAAPHTEALFRLPLSGVEQAVDARSTFYAHLSYYDAAGRLTGRDAVELLPENRPLPSVAEHEIRVSEEADGVEVSVGEAVLHFDPDRGELAGIRVGSSVLAEGLRPVVWRPLDPCEQTAFVRADRNYPHDLTAARPEVLAWDVRQLQGRVEATAQVRYTVAEDEFFTVAYRYLIRPDGSLSVHYELLPHLSITQLPVVGLTLKTASAPDRLCWLGPGDGDAYPYRSRAQIFGYWGGNFRTVTGNKAARRVDLFYPERKVEVAFDGYFWHPADDLSALHLLSGVFARPEKGRQAGENMPALRTDTGLPFVGDVTIAF